MKKLRSSKANSKSSKKKRLIKLQQGEVIAAEKSFRIDLNSLISEKQERLVHNYKKRVENFVMQA